MGAARHAPGRGPGIPLSSGPQDIRAAGVSVEVHPRIADIPADDWNRCAGHADPFVGHAWLEALEASGCVGGGSGWHPAHLLLRKRDQVVAVAPRYIKDHGWGEFVFDHLWAGAAASVGEHWYPKSVVCVPFTPVPGRRLLAATDSGRRALLETLSRPEPGRSSTHLLFAEPAEVEAAAEHGALLRTGLRFQWRNAGYRDFEDFLGTLRSKRRKAIRRERRQVAEAGIHFTRCNGRELDAAQWAQVYSLYARTYRVRGQQPYLKADFWPRIAAAPGQYVRVVRGWRDGTLLCAALFVVGERTLYGRHWGTREDLPGLHFECCYYQGMELCLQEGLQRYDAGVQGWHRIHRGFEPLMHHSAHWVHHPRLRRAIARWLAAERAQLEAEQAWLQTHRAGHRA